MRAISDAATVIGNSNRESDITDLFETLVSSATDAMNQTTSRLPVLQEANVVDAGAMGLVRFLEGALGALRGDPVEKTATDDEQADSELTSRSRVPESEEQFCTEILVEGANL